MQFNSSLSYNIMENDIFNTATNATALNPIVIDGFPSQASNSLVRPDAFDLNFQNGIMPGYPVISALQEEPSGFGLLSSDVLVPRSVPLGRNSIVDALLISSRPNRETEFQDHFAEGTPISATALASLLATRNCLQENVNNLPISSPSVFPSHVLRSYASNGCTSTSHSTFDNTLNTGYDGALGDMSSRWDFDKFFALPELSGKPPERTGFLPFRLVENMDANGWISSNNANVTAGHAYNSSKFSNELSLSLATTQPSVVSGTAATDQCSDISSSGVSHHCLNETGLGSDNTSSNSRELSLSFGSYRPAHFSQVISRSRYLQVLQEILAEIASYSLENLDQQSYSTSGIGSGANMPLYPSFADNGISVTGSDELTNDDGSEIHTEHIWQRRDIESKKSQLLALLQVVDDRYSQCLDEIHTVISAFHAATELNPQMHARFALHTVSFLYKNLRERISNQILAMGANHKSGSTKEKEGSAFDTSFIQKQWALQQLKRKEHQLWRPQRGLPERSVSVLRTWMFQNFLHPYPKDAEKHLLAVKSGLTRSQVSNWFINARVRLWKPMIEEMYSEMNRRKARRNDEGIDSNGRSGLINMDNQRFKLN